MMSRSTELLKKIVISGKYYDTFLYSGKLYLVSQDTSLDVINWDSFIDKVSTDDYAFYCCYKDSRFLYNPQFSKFHSDQDFRDLLLEKIKRIDNINVDEEQLKKHKIKKTRKLEVIPNDLLIYKNELYLASSKGVSVYGIKRPGYSGKFVISKNDNYIFDHDTVNIFGQKGKIYFACLNDGLYVYNSNSREYWYEDYEEEDEDFTEQYGIKKISNNYVSFIKSNYSSLFVGSYYSKAELRVLKYSKEEKDFISDGIKDLDALFSAQEKQSFYISSHDKIYRLSEEGIHLIKYMQSVTTNEEQFSAPLLVATNSININEIVSSSIELFGLVIEFKNKLSIITSEDKIITLHFENEELVNYRTFPYSKVYKNQLHLIYENRMEILSLNHDFLINQTEKKFGLRYTKNDFKRDEKFDE